MAKNFNIIAKRLDFENKTLKERLRVAKHFCTSEEFLRKKVNKLTYNFLKSQIQHQSVTPKGRRFSLDDKLLAIKLLKQSPKCYRLLQKIFALPSNRTLSKLLRQIPFKDGINNVIIKTLKCSVAKLRPIDRNCVLMFDEMCIEPNLTYCVTEDRIEGFTTNEKKNNRPCYGFYGDRYLQKMEATGSLLLHGVRDECSRYCRKFEVADK